MQMIDKDNPELSNFYTASTLKCLNALASQIIIF